MQHDKIIADQAAAWAVRTGDAGFEDWTDFTAWLQEDAAHSPAYDAAVLAVENCTAALRQGAGIRLADAVAFTAANDVAPPRRGWALPSMAAALAGILALGGWHYRTAEDVYFTAPGQTLHVALGDGTTVDMAGGSKLAVARYDSRSARLEEGRALFNVRHDEGDPFTLAAGTATLVDAGTIFDVAIASDRVDVEVAEGAVIVNPHSANLRLEHGERATGRRSEWQRGTVTPGEVGSWRSGQLAFRDATLAEIAEDLSRATGLVFEAAPGTATKVLSGSIMVSGLRSDPASVGPLLGLAVRSERDRWILSSP